MSQEKEAQGSYTLKAPEEREVEELRMVLKAVSEFLKDLAPTIKDIMETFVGSLKGDEFGEEVGKFYKSLIEAGMKEELAAKLTEQFLTQRMEQLTAITRILPELQRIVPRKEVKIEEVKKEGGEEPKQ